MAIYSIQGNMVGRKEENGPQGSGVSKGVSFTLAATDRHGVAYRSTVRRITPLECARLQGFPDDWTDGLVDEDPSETDVQYWRDAWLEWWESVGAGKGIKKPKDEKAVRRWLASEPSDSDKYKMWGNGIALPCAVYVFEGFSVEEE